MTDSNLTDRFHQAMIATYQEALKIGYRPTRFLQMVNEQGGVETARAILAQDHTTDGFGTLWEKQRLDLTAEALVLKPEFAELFGEEERARARARLAEVSYHPPWDQAAPAAPAAAPSLVDQHSRAVSNTQGAALPAEEGDDSEDALNIPSETVPLERWRAELGTRNELARQIIASYPEWLKAQLGQRVELRPGSKQRLNISLDGRFVQRIRINADKDPEVWFTDLTDAQFNQLRSQLHRPSTLDHRTSETTYPNNWRFNIATAGDSALMQDLMLQIAGGQMAPASAEPPQNAPYDRAAIAPLLARFRRSYQSFNDQRYHDQERFYKDHFAARMRDLISKERLGSLIAAGDFAAAQVGIRQTLSGSVVTPSGFRQQNNLLNQWDRRPILDAPAEPLTRLLYDLLYGTDPFAERFDAWVALLSPLKPGVWPAATYFLALSDPAQYIFVKPTPWQLCLRMLGDTTPWPTRPNAATYQRLQAISAALSTDLTALGPCDMIDVQSFLWLLSEDKTSSWIFTSSPSNYDLQRALSELEEIRWRIPSHHEAIHVGDTVYLWEGSATPALAAIARVVTEPQMTVTDVIDTRYHHGPVALSASDIRAVIQIEQVLMGHIGPQELSAIPKLSSLTLLHSPNESIYPLNQAEAEALAALVEVSYDPPWDQAAPAPAPAAPSLVDQQIHAVSTTQGEVLLAEDESSLAKSNAPGAREATGVEAGLSGQDQIQIALQAIVNNGGTATIAQIYAAVEAHMGGLHLSSTGKASLRFFVNSVAVKAEYIYPYNDQNPGWHITPDGRALLNLPPTERQSRLTAEVENPVAIAPGEDGDDHEFPPDLPNGPVFVVLHKSDHGEQRYGASYQFTPNASGDARKLINALETFDNGGPPVSFIIYRPGPYYAFTAWAEVTSFTRREASRPEDTVYVVNLAQHELHTPLNLKENAAGLMKRVAWLSNGLKSAFNYRSIRQISAADFATIMSATASAQKQPMTIADAAFTVLSRAGGGPLHLSEVLARIQSERLATMRGDTPQLTLASTMLRDERFHNRGRNTWELAAFDEADDLDLVEKTETNEDLPAPPVLAEPPTRQPTIYADEEAHFWRIHFPRELWEQAQRAGVIAIGWPLDSLNQSVKRFRQIAAGDRIVVYIQGGVIGGVGVVVRPFDLANPRVGLPAETLGDDFNQYLTVAWADAPATPVELLDALRHPSYTPLYNRIKNPHTVIPLGRDDYINLLRLLQVDDAGQPKTESRLPSAWAQLAPYLALARTLSAGSASAEELLNVARSSDPPSAEGLDADDLVAELMQLRLIVPEGSGYLARPYVAGDERALLRLSALALLATAEGTADQYHLPARQVVARLRAASGDQQIAQFAPELGAADAVTLASWYAEAGLIAVDAESWQPLAAALTPLPGDDPATAAANLFLTTLLAEIDGTLPSDLAVIGVKEPLPLVEDLDGRLRELGHDLLFDQAVVRRIYRSLLAGRHVVLSGPPGTGKTELARRLPSLLWSEPPAIFSRISVSPERPPVEQVSEQRDGYAPMIVTATEDWGVRDVVGGIGPRLDGQSGALSYTIEHGALTRAVLQHYDETSEGRRLPPSASNFVRRDYRPVRGRRYRGTWLVIDEFTRAPIDAAFGSLLTTLSGGQNATLAVPTQGESREVPLPRDFRIIGTLNSFDRHFLNQMSEAMKRRFDFIDVLPPPPAYAAFEQGIAVKEALRRMGDDGFEQITWGGEPPTYRWAGILRAEPRVDAEGLRYGWQAEAPEAEAALNAFWRLFSAIRVFRQLGTAQIVAVYLNLLTGVRVGMGWPEALDTALADTLADQLQVLTRDEQQIVEAFVEHAGVPDAFSRAFQAILSRVPAGRRPVLRAAFREADQLRDHEHQSDISLAETPLTDAQIGRVFDLSASLALPSISVFRRRLRDLAGERGL